MGVRTSEASSDPAVTPRTVQTHLRGQGYDVSRCHLIGDKLGGSGRIRENLFTCMQNPTNSANMYHRFEKQVADMVVDNGETVFYSVNAMYRTSYAAVPKSVDMFAIGSKSGMVHDEFPNEAWKDGEWVSIG
ncbi:DNA/RNA non-specific endonuclease [Yinghuangia aomiensis]